MVRCSPRPGRRNRLASRWILPVVATLLVSACSVAVPGAPTSPLYDPFSVAGIPAVDGPSGVRDGAPEPTGTVYNTDGGEADQLSLLGINDVEEFWREHYAELPGTFRPVENLVSYDSTDPKTPLICGADLYQRPNALFCQPDWLIAWDRAAMVPVGRKYFGDTAIAGLMAHEYGHAVQRMARLVSGRTPVLVGEQQADCFGGAYLRWLAEGKSPRFQLSTGDGLNHVLAAVVVSRDPVIQPGLEELVEDGHGTALDRVSAVQIGFMDGVGACAGIDMDEIDDRRGDLPLALQETSEGHLQTGEVPINEEVLAALMARLTEIFDPVDPPELSIDAADCPDSRGKEAPARYCAATNTISADLAALQELGRRSDESDERLLQGDNTALSIVVSRYVLALQHQQKLPLDTAAAALRTACYTGIAHRELAEPGSVNDLVLTAGDLDEAVAGLLTNGLVASDVTGDTVPAGFTRILAFRSGVTSGDDDLCNRRFS